MRAVRHILLALPFVAGAAMAEIEAREMAPVQLPSGLEATFQEMLWDRPGGGLVYRFRFVAEGFAGVEDIEVVMADLEYLCTEFAIPRLSNTGPKPGTIIVSLANQPSEFGVYDPEITQIFEAYKVQGDTCIWEMF